MGTILSTKVKDDGKIIFEVALEYEESVQLKGHMNDVHVFSENVADIDTHISQRGKNEATKYFLIPRELRKDLKFNAKTKCQKIETKTKTIFIYVVDKIGL
ncbi:MAG: hypothetical protein IH969_01235 [Candidatus Krumholzibacteriota bacterium]|nr:hypothetical protein [Candidatus Krumholzibacteriota bacterium]